MSADPFSIFFRCVNRYNSSLNVPSFGDDLYFYMKHFVPEDKALITFGANFATIETWSMGLILVLKIRGSTRLQWTSRMDL